MRSVGWLVPIPQCNGALGVDYVSLHQLLSALPHARQTIQNQQLCRASVAAGQEDRRERTA